MTTLPPESLPMPVLGIRQKAAILLGWLLVNLLLLAPVLPRWNEAALAPRQVQALEQAALGQLPQTCLPPPSQAVCDGRAGPGLPERLYGILAMVGLAAFVAAWFRKDGQAFWCGVLAVSAQGSALLLSQSMAPLSGGLPITAVVGLHALMQIPLFFFVRSFARMSATPLAWIVPVVVAAEVLVALRMPEAWWPGWLAGAGGLWLLLGLWMVRALARGLAAGMDLARQLLALSVLLTVLAVTAQVASWWGAGAAASGWVPAAGVVLAVSCLLGMVLQLLETAGQEQAARTALAEQMVRERTELAGAFELRQQHQESEVQARERARIMRELHDGLGSQLVAALALLSAPQPSNRAVAEQIGLCLQELRCAIDTLCGDFHDVGELLGAFRDRIEPALDARGILLDWQVQPLLPTASLNACERLHVMRIVQEAFANIIKHSRASQVILRAETLAGGCCAVDIIDNGCGFRPGAALAHGWGLSNMQERAALMGARLSWADVATGGVHVRLELDCAPSEAAASNVMRFPDRRERQRSARYGAH